MSEQGKWKPYNVKAILNNFELVLKSKNIDKLNKPTYNFIIQCSGFIAHYDLYGFKHYYQDLRDLINDIDPDYFESSAERDETDSDFLKWSSYDYWHSKAEIKRGIVKLVRQYKTTIYESFADQERGKDLFIVKQLIKKHGLTQSELF